MLTTHVSRVERLLPFKGNNIGTHIFAGVSVTVNSVGKGAGNTLIKGSALRTLALKTVIPDVENMDYCCWR